MHGEVLQNSEGKLVWAKFLERQVSWDGPCSPSEALSIVRGLDSPNAPLSFDDEAAATAGKQLRFWRKHFQSFTLHTFVQECFSFVELCDCQSSMNSGASTSPIDELPMPIVLTSSEAGRASHPWPAELGLCFCFHAPSLESSPSVACQEAWQAQWTFAKLSAYFPHGCFAQAIG